MTRVVIAADKLEAHLLPKAGGSIARFDRIASGRRQPLLRGVDRDDVGALEAACFPLVPFANRIRGGAFSFRGRTVTLAANMPPDPSPLHGQGWRMPWELISRTARAAVMRCVHAPGEWPWHYEARQHIAIDPDGLSIQLECRNLADDPMPCALGLHPYHPCDFETVLDTMVQSVWTVDEAILPVRQLPARGPYNLRQRRICGQALDNGFGGWIGSATISWPGEPQCLRLSSPDAAHFQIYSPATGGFFAAEPVQNANAALNEPESEWAKLGIGVLEPGAVRQLHVRYDVLPA